MLRVGIMTAALALSSAALAHEGPAGHTHEVPPLTGHVNDRAGLLSPQARAALEAKLTAYERSTGQQFALLTIPTLGEDALEDFAMRVVERWQLGKRGKDDGLLLLIVTDERRVRVENGYGLEGQITDALSSRVIRDVLAPAFRAQDYAGGIDRAFDVLMQAASGQTVRLPDEEPGQAPRVLHRRGGSILPILFLILFLVLSSRRSRRRGLWFLGGMGAGGFGGGSRGGGFGGFSGGGGRFGGGGASGGW